MIKLEMERSEVEGYIRLFDPTNPTRFAIVISRHYFRSGQSGLDDIRTLVTSREIFNGVEYELPDGFAELFLSQHEARKRRG